MTSKREKLLAGLMQDPAVYTVTLTLAFEAVLRGGADLLTGPDPPRSYVHYEFKPPQEHRTHPCDLVVHRSSAKVFLDNDVRPGVMSTGDTKTTVTWRQSFQMAVNDELLTALHVHGLSVRVWEGKDKASSRARFDRERVAGGRNKGDGERVAGGGATVSGGLARCSVASTMRASAGRPSAAGGGAPLPAVQRSLSLVPRGNLAAPSTAAALGPCTHDSRATARGGAESRAAGDVGVSLLAELLASERPFGAAVPAHGDLTLHLHSLFTGALTVEETLDCQDWPGFSRLESLRVGVSLDRPLLDVAQSQRLNPLSIHLVSAHDLPSQPVSFATLDRQCRPVFAIVDAPGVPLRTPPLRARRRGHAADLVFDVYCVLFMGLYSPAERAGAMSNLCVQVHDRCRVQLERDGSQLFGSTAEDYGNAKFSDYRGGVDRPLPRNPLTSSDERLRWDPHAEGRVDCRDFLLGVKRLSVTVDLRPCARRDLPLVTDHGQVAERPMLAGHFVEYGSYLRVDMEIAHPLEACQHGPLLGLPAPSGHIPLGGFLRLVYVTPAVATGAALFVARVRVAMEQLNASALGLVPTPPHLRWESASGAELARALATYAASSAIAGDLDTLTGVHVHLPSWHIVVVEGPAAGSALTALTTGMPPLPHGGRRLFHAHAAQPTRLFATHGACLRAVALSHDPEYLLANSDLYIRASRTAACLRGLTQLRDLCQAESLISVLQHDLLPSDVSLTHIVRHFGSESRQVDPPLSGTEPQSALVSPIRVVGEEHPLPSISKETKEIDFVGRNRFLVAQRSERNTEHKSPRLPCENADLQQLYQTARWPDELRAAATNRRQTQMDTDVQVLQHQERNFDGTQRKAVTLRSWTPNMLAGTAHTEFAVWPPLRGQPLPWDQRQADLKLHGLV